MVERNPGEDGKPLRREHTLDDFVAHLQTPTTGRRLLVSKVFLDEETTVFEVKVVSKRISDEDVYEETEVINCHVCDEVIPRGYFREHAQSAIHQNNKKISGMFLERLLNETKLLKTNPISNMLYDPYYCSPCTKLVPGGQTLAHGLSVEHHKAIDKETALNVFVKKYVDTEPQSQQPQSASQSPLHVIELDDTNSRSNDLHLGIIGTGSNGDHPASIAFGSNSHQPESKASLSNGHQPELIASDSNGHWPEGIKGLLDQNRPKGSELHTLQPTNSVHELNEPHTSNRGVTHELDNAGVSSEIKQFKIYAKTMLEKYNIEIRTWVLEDNNYLTLEAPNGHILKVTVDVFHSFMKSSSGLLCQLCNTKIAVSEKRAHIDTEKHARLISYPVDNMFCREISDRWSHDLVENKFNCFEPKRAQTIENPPPVTETNPARKNHNKIEIQTTKSPQTRKDQEPVVSTSRDDRNGPMDVEDFMVYFKKMVSKYNLKYKLPSVKEGGLLVVTPRGYEAVVTVESFHGYKPTQTSMYCQLCEMTISTDTRVHSETRLHVKHITQCIDQHFTRKISVMSHCVLCNTTVLDGAEHSATDPQHNSYVQARVSVEGSDKNKMIFCDVCDIHLNPKAHHNHIKKQRHFKSKNKNCDQRETLANMIFCDICTISIHCNNFQEHCKGKRHTVNTKRTRRDPQTMPVEQPDVAHSHSSPTALNQHKPNFLEFLMSMISKYNLKCALPGVEHDGVVIKTPKGYREKFSFEVFHSYKQAKSSVVCQVCRMNVLSKDTTAHSMTRPHVVNILQPVDDNFSRKINKSWNHCLVCNITVLNSFDHASYSPIHRDINGPGARPRDGSGDGNAEKMFCNSICG